MSNYKIPNLNKREEVILTTLIEAYIQSSLPVSSTFLSKNYNLNVSSATIRNVMSNLEDKGFLTHLHTSGGRLPTDIGYRFYVDSIKNLNNNKTLVPKNLESELLTISNNVDELLNATVLMLSKVSNMFGVVTICGYQDSILTDIELVPIQGERVMLVLALDTGVVKSIVLNLDVDIDIKLINKITQVLKDRLLNLSLKEIQNTIITRLNDVEIYNHELVQVIINDSKKYFSIDKEKLIFTSSAGALLHYPEFQDIDKFQRILPALDKKYLINYFESVFSDSSLEMIIGSENKDSIFKNCAIISMNFECDSALGRLAVIGPKRTNYINKQIILR